MPSPLQPTQSKRLVKFPFPFKGLNSTAPSLVLKEGYSSLARNVRFAQGEISSRPNTASLSAFGITPINGAFTSYRADNTILSLASQYNTMSVLDNSSGLWTANVFGSGQFGLDEDFWSFTDVFGEIYASNGVGMTVWTADGGVFSDLGSAASPFPYSGRYLESFAGRLVMANTREGGIQHEDRVRWSVAQSPRDFTSDSSAGANDIVDLAGPITGSRVLAGRLFLHKRTGITAMIETGLRTPSFSFQTVVDGIGTIAGRTLLNIHGAQFFLGSDDVYVYDGASPPQPIGESIRKDLFANINWAKVGNCFAVDYSDFHEYHLFIPEGSAQWPLVKYVYNYFDHTWTKHDVSTGASSAALVQTAPAGDTWDGGDDGGGDTWDAGADIPWDTPSVVAKLVPFWGCSDGTLRRIDETSVTIGATATLTTGDSDLDNPGVLKTVGRVRCTLRQRNTATLSLSLSADGGATFTTPTSAALPAPTGDENSLKTLFFPVGPLTGEFFRLKLTSPDRFSLVSWELEVVDRSEVK